MISLLKYWVTENSVFYLLSLEQKKVQIVRGSNLYSISNDKPTSAIYISLSRYDVWCEVINNSSFTVFLVLKIHYESQVSSFVVSGSGLRLCHVASVSKGKHCNSLHCYLLRFPKFQNCMCGVCLFFFPPDTCGPNSSSPTTGPTLSVLWVSFRLFSRKYVQDINAGSFDAKLFMIYLRNLCRTSGKCCQFSDELCHWLNF